MTFQLKKEELLANFMDDEELLFESIDLFMERADERYKLLSDAVKERNEQRVMEEGHTLKGMVAIFTQESPYEAAKKLEFMGRNKDLTGVDEALADFKDKLDELKQALTEWRNE
ncbi:MAG: Hpt domain-containing protein [Deltaproteobacteria bacterium]|nr:Hpt domain-containing protein [Deltaproteobacteria bacterium]